MQKAERPQRAILCINRKPTKTVEKKEKKKGKRKKKENREMSLPRWRPLDLSSAKIQRPIPRFGFVGFGSFSLFLAFLLVTMAQGQREGWGSDLTSLPAFALAPRD